MRRPSCGQIKGRADLSPENGRMRQRTSIGSSVEDAASRDAPPTDAELLARWCDRADREALEQLVRRHGGMVLGVCQRALGDTPDADDAFQAVFLVLVRKAASLA